MESKRLKYQRENCHFIDSGMIAIVVILKGICDTEINFVKILHHSLLYKITPLMYHTSY